MSEVLLGTCGWSYAEWEGILYPYAQNKLKQYSSIFPTAEIDSTFYALPGEGTVLGWSKNTPPDFIFSAKLPQTITHKKAIDPARGVACEPTKCPPHELENPRQPENPSFSQAFSDLLAFGLWMRRSGYRPSTITSCIKALKAVARRSCIFNPESVKAYLASAKTSENRKQTVVDHLARFYRWKRTPFNRPNYKRIELLPFIPLEREVDQLIAGLSPKWARFLQFVKESACRPGEAWALRWIDVDRERSQVRIRPEKNGTPRQFRISESLLAMLDRMQHKWDYVFHDPTRDPMKSLDDFRRTYIRQRRRIAQQLGNPRLLQVTFGTLRHFKATMEYHRTKDILYVMRLLGHKNLKNTIVYTSLVSFEKDEYICKVVRTVEEAKDLVEHGFEYVTDMDDAKLFRIRK